MNVSDPFNLQRFVDAQRGIYERAERELTAGHKESHWMWFIFPQIHGLGHSAMAQTYGILNLAEADAYLAHSILGDRLRHCTRLVTAANELSVEEIFGYPDCLKFHSCMTLFARSTDDNEDFREALRKYFRSELDPQTLRRL
jgi:uncharacterized protein (DUF1810 family)